MSLRQTILLDRMATTRSNSPNAQGPSATEVHAEPLDLSDALSGSDEVRSGEIQLQLERILASSSFRNSRRQTQFLRFVVKKALSGKSAEIKERLIGTEVFDRPPDYDVTTDPIVRGAAVELRKRIAQYYADPSHASQLRLELPLGTYVPTFHWPTRPGNEEHDSATPESPALNRAPANALAFPGEAGDNSRSISQPKKRLFEKPAIWFSSLVLLAALGLTFLLDSGLTNSNDRQLNRFWAPLMKGNESILVCAGDLNQFVTEHPIENDTWEHFTRTRNHLDPNVGAALLRIGSLLGSKGKRATLRLADLTELSDLRQQPVIFVGGFNNQWTQRILANLRFRMMRPQDRSYAMITDQKNLAFASWRIDFLGPISSITRDYSLVTRIDDPLTGQPVVLLSGLGSYGNSAASEFVSNPTYFSQFSKSAPKGWENRTVQIVLETTVVNGRVSIPNVVAEQVD